MGCAVCFPVLVSLGASLGLGFLSSYEGALGNSILPALALFALVLNSHLWGKNAYHIRGILSVSGPIALLLTLYPLWKFGWSTCLSYAGLVTMFLMSLLELVTPSKPVFTT
jgi:mercuric ion transport protein